MDFTPYFAKYETLVAEADAVFDKVAGQHSDCIACKKGCSDCCNALFDLSLIEALYINYTFGKSFGFGPRRSAILRAAADTDRHLTKLKKDYFRIIRDSQGNPDGVEKIMEEASRARVRCPLLLEEKEEDGNQRTVCALYAFRPITCRLYGIPTAIGGKGHVCGKSGFTAGKGYPTVHMDKIQDKLDALSLAVQTDLGSRFKELHKVYVPVSMALLTKYDETYMGLTPAEDN